MPSILLALIDIVSIIAVLFITLVFILLFLRFYLSMKAETKGDYKDTVFLIKMPKESAKVDEEKERGGTSSQDQIRDKISIMHTLYANLVGLKKQGFLSYFFYGPQTYVSAEIVVKEGLIHFYLVCPFRLSNFVEQQIHAQFPDAEVSKEVDYNIFPETGEIKSAYLKLRKDSVLPIKSYQELESDPLNAITNALSKVDVKEGAAIQIISIPERRVWGSRGMRIAREINNGKSLKEALGIGFNPVKILQKIIYGTLTSFKYVLTSGSKKKEENLNKDLDRKDKKLSPLDEEIIKGIEKKASQFAFKTNIRIVASSPMPGRALSILYNITNSFTQFDNGEKGNGFKIVKPFLSGKAVSDFIFRRFRNRYSSVLSAEELSSIWHLPLPSTETPNILWLSAKRAAPPVNLPTAGIILGKSIYRGKERIIRVQKEDRRRHMYVIGKSGSGKSTLLSNMAISDIQSGEGVCVLDPHGDLVESILEHIPKERVDDVIYFDPSDTERPIGLNMLEFKTEEQKDFAVQEMIAIFYKLFPPEMIGPMFEHNMRNVMLTLMADKEYPGTIADIPRMFTDKGFQRYKAAKLKDPVVKAFWEKEMAQTTDFHKSEMLGYLISKVGRFVENEMMRNIIGQPKSGFDFREVMDKRRILLINLSKGKTGEVNSSLLGLIIVAKLQMAALGRANLPEEQRYDFYLYIDEFQNFITDSISTILSEARKYRLNLILAHQYLGQLKDERGNQKVLDAVLGNVGTIISFRVGVEDAEIIAKEFAPVFNEYDVVNIEKFKAYIKLLINNTAAPAFDMHTFPPKPGFLELAQSIKELSRLKYGRPKEEVEAEILERTKLGASSAKADFSGIEPSL